MSHEAIDFSPLKAANIPVAHFARLCGANRVSAFHWMRGTQPRGLYRAQVERRLKQISAALERGTLPYAPVPRPKQYDALLNALKSN